MSEDQGKTIGDFRFGLDSAEKQARFVESIYRELEPVRAMGVVDPGLTYSDIADMMVDTISNYAGMGAIPATEMGTLLVDALEQLAESESEYSFEED